MHSSRKDGFYSGVELGDRLIEVLENEELRARLRERVRETAEPLRAGDGGNGWRSS